jgi:hypothetical protein
MRKHPHLLVFGALAIAPLMLGCAGAAPASAPALAPVHTPASPKAAAETAEPESSSVTSPKVGDFFVHMISGSFRKHPALLTERVTGKEGDAWIIEYRLEDSTGVRGLRAWVNGNGEVKKVVRLIDGGEKPGTVADYDALMATTNVVPDSNEGLTASTQGTCMIGPSELDCETKSYRVFIGDKEASLGVTASHALRGRDIAGEITAADGTVIYRSELLEHGNEADSKDTSISLLSDE